MIPAMKNDYIKFRVSKKEKQQIQQDAELAGCDDMSPYILQTLREKRAVLRK